MSFKLYFSGLGSTQQIKFVYSDFDFVGEDARCMLSFAYHNQRQVYWSTVKDVCDSGRVALDSGAYSAKHTGKVIDLDEYIEYCLEYGARYDYVVTLDEIGDAKQTLRNTKRMLSAGVERLLPVYHYGSDWKYLRKFKEMGFPVIGIGGPPRIGKNERVRFLNRVFAEIWPHRVHIFGLCNQHLIQTWPVWSVDSSGFFNSHVRFAVFNQYGRKRISMRKGTKLDDAYKATVGEMRKGLAMQNYARGRWASDYRKLKEKHPLPDDWQAAELE